MTAIVSCIGLVLLSAGSRVVTSDSNYEEPYCGLYCMYGGLSALGLKPDFDRMNDSRYLSGRSGSTATDLVNLASEQGSTGTFRANLTLADLREAQNPIVLHGNVPASRTEFHHWLLFLGWDKDAVRVYDPPRAQYTLSQAELLSHWDGIGVVLGNPARKWRMFQVNYEILLAFFLVASSGGIVLWFAHSARHPAIGILLASIVSALVWHSTVGYGFLRNRFALDTIAASHDAGSVSSMDFNEFKQFVDRPGVTIVDARMSSAYNRSHVPGAINIPISVGHGYFKDVVATIPVENQIIVYCQSEQCGWSEAVAELFPAHGYRRVAIFPGGMRAWKEAAMSNTKRGP